MGEPANRGRGSSSGGMMMHGANLKRRFFVSLVLTIPVLLLSSPMGLALPITLSFPGSDWLVAVLATVLFAYGGWPFLRGAADELRRRAPAMMTLVALGITTAYVYSMYAFVMGSVLHADDMRMDFFWELATLIVIMLLGHWIEMRAVMGAGDALKEMAELLPAQAHVLQEDGSYADVPLDEVQVGQTVMVEAGEKVPADGEVTDGSSSVNEALVTGEARAVEAEAGDMVFGGSQNGDGTLYVRVTGTGQSGYLAQVMRLVSEAQQEKSHAEVLSDKVARWLFYAAVAVGLAAFAAWLVVTRSVDDAVTRMVTVFVIACPHALGLAIPLVAARSTSLGARNGLLVRRRRALETAPRVNVVMMDKTGTLTEGDFRVAEVRAAGKREGSASGSDADECVLALMAGLEQSSSHPLAASIVAEARERGVRPVDVRDVQAVAGVGVKGTLDDGSHALIANARYLDEQGIPYERAAFDELAGRGLTVSYLVVDGEVCGVAAQGDQIKPTARQAVRELKARGVVAVMLTGDNEAAARSVARTLGIDEFRAGLLPQDKVKLVQQRRDAGDVVMMVGDGINDAPALARADVGVAIGAGTDVAIDSADVVLVKSDPEDIVRLLDLGTNTTRKIKQNLWWGAGYNIVAIPLAAGVLAPVGILLSPAAGAVLMSQSTVIVAVNAMTLKSD
ncbi:MULTISPECIES: copper-translocating P-type ATPase [Eggerthella]|uniref:copper-translocating P-type ATPase n=1 Tax=Eggerthella TaxID=84111 RepID=UPI00136CBE18|nr:MULTISPECIES: copper-translocating P-type ATPase [Eggerthella]MCC2784051.1 copper-translocating P-type ATPase [Eggerthella lenta]MCQ4797224.1 copper-translocating P-type ATPase [Eggerthella lenta]MDB1778850.1 copper-translocating P-type ATPase [Eggerthella lenta]MDB1799285.1 copper-translocating P-type ATPase [Eggerthella lenta]MDU5064537.1 copper-translocating P-type ATPase [Eggerthella sp.]